MPDKFINAHNLSPLIGLAYNTVNKDLTLFDNYAVQDGKRYYYRFNFYFLDALCRFYAEKAKKANKKYRKNYLNAVKNLKKIMKKL